MFHAGDLLFLDHLTNETKQAIEDIMEMDWEDIEFYFIEYENDKYAVISAESDYISAILRCPVDYLDEVDEDRSDVNNLLDHVIRNVMLDRSLETRNRQLFDMVMDYVNKPKVFQKRNHDDESEQIYIDMILEDDLDMFIDDLNDLGYYEYYDEGDDD